MYTAYFGFREKPFNVTPDPRFFYLNVGYDEAYANLLYGIRERKGFLLLTGEVGTGKTTILQRLMDELESSVRFVFFYNTNLTFEELMTFICEELGLAVKDTSQLAKIRALNEFLLEQLRKGSTTVLVIDEAQNLREEIFENIRLLSNLETPREKLLQIILAGQPELEAKLERSQLRQLKQRIAVQWRLEGLGEEEVGAFVQYRLKAVGYEGRELFSRDAIRKIAAYSKGTPRLINIICDKALLIAYADAKKRVSAEIISEVARDMRLGLAGPMREFTNNPLRSSDREHQTYRHETPLHEQARMADTAKFDDEANNKKGFHSNFESAPTRLTNDPTTQFLDVVATALTEAMGPMAPIVLRSHLTALDDRVATQPMASLAKIVELVSPEILDKELRAEFQQKMSAVFGAPNGNGRTSNSI
jgi:general secretion pathway protein A